MPTHEIEAQENYRGRLLLVDDDIATAKLYEALLLRSGFKVDIAHNLSTMSDRIRNLSYDFVLLDLNLGEEMGLHGISTINKESPQTKVFILTGNGSIEKAVEAMERGACGFFTKGQKFSELLDKLTIKPSNLVEEAQRVAFNNLGLIGKSPALLNLMGKIEKLRSVDSSILILGESGSGKEVLARAIHNASVRSKEKFIAINCGAIPETLLESELFGHKRGAFTDAKSDRKGIFELCSEGTLLLDEIGDMPHPLQTKLLRVLQEREITPLGSNATIKINTRVIAATHKDVIAETKDKRFREDLYYRLSVVILRVPSLRERKEDIPLLVEHFISLFNLRFNKTIAMPSPAVMARIKNYPWPGNIRELKNAIERAVVLSSDDDLSMEDMFAHLQHQESTDEITSLIRESADWQPFFDMPLTDAKRAFEKIYLEHHLFQSDGNIMSVSEKSKRYRADIYRLIQRHQLDQVEFKRN